MFLSDKVHDTQGAVHWQAFELEAFGAQPLAGRQGPAEFVALQSGDTGDSAFTPFEIGGDRSQAGRQSSEERIAAIEQEAYEKGFAQGEKDGLELGEAKAAKVLEKIEGLLEEVRRAKSDMIRENEHNITALVFEIARKVIHSQVEYDDTAVKGPIMNALMLTAEKDQVVLKVNPEDFAYVEKLRPQLSSEHRPLRSVTIHSDPTVGRGGCLLETSGGDIDASLDTQLEMIRQSIRELYGRGGDDGNAETGSL